MPLKKWFIAIYRKTKQACSRLFKYLKSLITTPGHSGHSGELRESESGVNSGECKALDQAREPLIVSIPIEGENVKIPDAVHFLSPPSPHLIPFRNQKHHRSLNPIEEDTLFSMENEDM